MKKIGIVEDEVLIADSLERNLRKLGFEPVGPAMDFDEAVEMIENESPDLVLLDIRIEGDKTGVDVAQYIRENHQIPFIFLTSHLDRKTLEEAKFTEPSGYLTKPFNVESLFTTIEVALHNYVRRAPGVSMITLKTGTQSERVAVDEILYLKADHVYVHVVLPSRSLLVRQPLKDLMAELPEDKFFQVHRSYAVNIRHVVSFGSGKVVLSGIEVPVSRSFREELVKRLT